MNATRDAVWPALPLADWRDTYATLHMWTQIVGKTRLALAPMLNHWWQVTLYVTPRGLTTSAMPCGQRTVEVEFDFIAHMLMVRTSDGAVRGFPLDAYTVADFLSRYIAELRAVGVEARFTASPNEVEPAIPFAEDQEHASYDRAAVHRWWQALVQVDRVMQQFRSPFIGKQSPVHFFWGSFDLATTRFSGRAAPRHPGGAPNCPDYVMIEAYSHECSSCGFWPGSDVVPEPAFYAYSYPEPAGYTTHPVRPAAAAYNATMREFVLPYEAVRNSANPDAALLDFMQSTYEAAAILGQWDRGALERPPGQRAAGMK
jgi:hypothetical protein